MTRRDQRNWRTCPCGRWHGIDSQCPDLVDVAVDAVDRLLVDHPDALPALPDLYQVTLDQLDHTA